MVTILLALSSSLGSPYRYDIEKGVGMDAKSKTCSKCGEEKLLDKFHIVEGREAASWCKLCHRKYRQDNKEKIAANRKQYHQDNKEKIKQYYQDNKEKILAQTKQYHQDNKERYAEYQKQHYQDNKEKIKQYYQDNKERYAEYQKQYYQDNRERKNELERTRRKNDDQFRIRKRLSGHLWVALKGIGKTKKASILSYIGCTIEFMKEHLNSTKEPDWGDGLHIDHIIPKSLFDHTNDEEIKKCWNWRNLRYLPAEENMSKHNTLDMDLVKSYGIEDLLPEGVDK
jgi:hypothetical protein